MIHPSSKKPERSARCVSTSHTQHKKLLKQSDTQPPRHTDSNGRDLPLTHFEFNYILTTGSVFLILQKGTVCVLQSALKLQRDATHLPSRMRNCNPIPPSHRDVPAPAASCLPPHQLHPAPKTSSRRVNGCAEIGRSLNNALCQSVARTACQP